MIAPPRHPDGRLYYEQMSFQPPAARHADPPAPRHRLSGEFGTTGCPSWPPTTHRPLRHARPRLGGAPPLPGRSSASPRTHSPLEAAGYERCHFVGIDGAPLGCTRQPSARAGSHAAVALRRSTAATSVSPPTGSPRSGRWRRAWSRLMMPRRLTSTTDPGLPPGSSRAGEGAAARGARARPACSADLTADPSRARALPVLARGQPVRLPRPGCRPAPARARPRYATSPRPPRRHQLARPRLRQRRGGVHPAPRRQSSLTLAWNRHTGTTLDGTIGLSDARLPSTL
jgi:hypothetical protein